MKRLVLAFALAVVSPQVTLAQATGAKPLPPGLPPGMSVPKSRPAPTLAERMTGRNERAIQSLGYFRCLSSAIVASRSGRVATGPRGEMIVCVQHRGEWRAVFGTFRETAPGVFFIRTQYVLRGEGQVVSEPVDTNKVAATARAMIRASSVPAPGSPRYEFLPAVIEQDAFLEIWYLPVQSDPSNAVVGGDSLIQMAPDGSREFGHSGSTPPIRRLEVLRGAAFLMTSSEEEIPTVSELTVGILALGLVKEVRILTKKWEWIQTASSGSWRSLARAP